MCQCYDMVQNCIYTLSWTRDCICLQFLQNFYLDKNSFLHFLAVLTFKKKKQNTKTTNHKTSQWHYCDELHKQLFVVAPLLRYRTELCWWHLEPLSFRALQKPFLRRQQPLDSFLCLLWKGLLDNFRFIWPGDSIVLHCLLALSFCLFELITYSDNLRLLNHSNQPIHGSVQQKAAVLGISPLMATVSPKAFNQLHIALAGHVR